MINDWINISFVKIEGAERLYPHGIEWKIAPGVNALIGGTGLGKTSLVYSIQFTVFGKLVSESAERIEREFFKGRLTKRSGHELLSEPPLGHVKFHVKSTAFAVTRNLLTGALVEANCDGKPLNAKNYESLLAEKVGIEGDFSGLTKLQSLLFFFGEDRYLLAWENRLQNELMNLMLANYSTYRHLEDLWSRAGSADSEARNISSQASRMEEDLKEMKGGQSKVEELRLKAQASELVRNRIQLEKAVDTIRKAIERDTRVQFLQDKRISTLQEEFNASLFSLEESENKSLDDNIIAAALADPTIASVRKSLENFYLEPQKHSCPCCGRVGIATQATAMAKVAAASTKKGDCVICSKDLPKPKSSGKSISSESLKMETNKHAELLKSALFQREQTISRISELRIEMSQALERLAEATRREVLHLRANPPASNHLESVVSQLRDREKTARRESDKYLGLLKQELAKTNAVFEKRQAKIVKAFKKYASLYLDEPCDVKFLQESELPGKRGPQIKAPHAAFFPVVSGETRPSSQHLSDAQRAFVDLAFRMALIDVWHQETNGTVTMIIETPEGAVDIAYMERVANMMRTFADQGHTLIITTNLNNDIFLPEVMSGWKPSERKTHLLNLLVEGRPRPVQKEPKHQKRFDDIMKRLETMPRSR